MENQVPGGQFLFRSGQTRIEDVWSSPQEDARSFSIKLARGFGTLPPGLILAKNMSAGGGAGEFMPYVPALYTSMDVNPYHSVGRSYLAADIADGATTLTIEKNESYRFQAGDELVVGDDGTTTPEHLGVIVSVAVGTILATITFTNPVTAAGGFDVANNANCYLNGSPASLVAADWSTGTTFTVPNASAEGFEAGQTAYAVSDTVDAETLGAIISVTPGATTTSIVVTTDPSGSFTTAQNGMVYVLTPTIHTAKCVLGRERETGWGELVSAGTAQGVGVFKHAQMKTAALGNLDAAAITALGGGQYEGYFYF